jgi:hypothetical protein
MGLLKDRTLLVLIGVLVIIFILCAIMLSQSNAGNRVLEPTNSEYTINAILQSGYLQEHNMSLENSSLKISGIGRYIDADGYRSNAATYRFMTTDGKTHVCQIYADTPTNYVVTEIDNESFVF